MSRNSSLVWVAERNDDNPPDEVRPKDLKLAAYVTLEAGEALIQATALRMPERLEDERFAEEISDLLLRYLEK